MKTCNSCGAALAPLAKFCGDCGAVAPTPTTEDALASVSAANASAASGLADRPDQALDAAPFARPQAAPEPPPLGAFCTNCGQKLPPDARFCGGCGTQSLTAIPAIPDPSTQTIPAVAGAHTHTWTAPQPRIEPPRPYEPAPPTTFAEMPAQSPPPPTTQTIVVPADSGGSKRRWIFATVALLVLVAAAAATAYIIAGRGGSSQKASTTATTTTSGQSSTSGQTSTTSTNGQGSSNAPAVSAAQFTKQIITVVRQDQGRLSGKLAHVASIGVGPGTLAGANAAAVALRDDLKTIQRQTLSPPDGVSQIGLLRSAIAAHRGYAGAIVALTSSVSAFTPTAANQVKADAVKADALYTQIGANGVTFQQESRLVTMASNMAQQQAQRALLRGYLSRISSILSFSAQGRKDLNTIAANIRANRLDPSSGADQIGGVVSNRESVISQIEQMQSSISSDPNVPAQIGSLLGQLHTAMTNSEEADQAYQSWAANLPGDYNYQYYGDTYNQAAQDASQYDVAATAAKRAFVDQYDPLARSVGLATWSSSGF